MTTGQKLALVGLTLVSPSLYEAHGVAVTVIGLIFLLAYWLVEE